MKTITTRAVKLLPLLSICALFALSEAHAAPTFNASASMAQIGAVLDGPGLSVSNPQITRGAIEQYGIMNNAKSTVGFDTGVFLSTGNVGSLQGPNNTPAYGYDSPQVAYRDPDLLAISPTAKYDPVALEFDIVPQGDKANFVFSFGSEEYPEFVCSQYNDAFGLFISGPGLSGTQNAAFLPNSRIPIAVNNINGGSPGARADGTSCQLGNTAYFIDNGNGTGNTATQLDGFTKTLTASIGGLQSGQTYHIKLAMADAGDAGYDSGAVFKWLTSTKSDPVDLSLTAASSAINPAYNSDVNLTWTVHNNSATPTSLVQVGIEWPAGLTWVGDDSGGAFNIATGEWNADVIPAGGSKTLTVRARVGTASNYSLISEISYAFNDDPDSTPLNRSSNPNEDDTNTLTIWPVANSAPSLPSNTAVSAAENQTSVTQVTATDANGDTLTYSLSGGADAAKFAINAATGILSFVAAPDYENPTDSDKNNTYLVQVTASDGSLSAVQTITVSVTNANEAPALPATAAVSLAENQLNVSTVKATDPDNNTLTYSLSGGADAAKFAINAATGVLSFVAAPDYESPTDSDKNNTYLVQVTASDGSLSAVQTITVTVTNVAENALPIITQGKGAATFSQTFTENTAAMVLDYDATDADGDTESNGLTWVITGGADKWAFTLHPNKGWLEFTGAPDFERPLDADKKNTYEVQVTVCDSKGGCTNQALTITIKDVAEDTDADGIADSAEIKAGTVNPYDNGQDSDQDGIPDYRDPDDDNDGINTQYEAADPNKDGNPSDARDSDTDTVPDYLDADDDGDNKPTSSEKADANGDHNPADAEDVDDDSIPNYLDNNDEPSVYVSMQAYLQGAYDPTTGLMSDTLRKLGYLPKLQPYGELITSFGYTNVANVPPFNYKGTETISDALYATTDNNAPVDWVLLELRDTAAPTNRIAAKAAILQRDGDIVNAGTGSTKLVFRGVPEGSYYVVLRHRNHLGVMTSAPLSLNSNKITAINLTQPNYAVYGTSNQRYIQNNVATLWAGDTNNSNTIVGAGPGSDSNVMLGALLVAPGNKLVTTHYQMPGYYATDLNLDGLTIFSGPNNDLNILLGNIMIFPDNTGANANFVVNSAVPR